nr:PREDICTED: uncharacterized protein LOC106702552 [Latimeria chalumnae]|eukprot:XP_014340700.1 PREDICTED: uncharacterized protein LOC106702552 [Latimeria chalumnae]
MESFSGNLEALVQKAVADALQGAGLLTSLPGPSQQGDVPSKPPSLVAQYGASSTSSSASRASAPRSKRRLPAWRSRNPLSHLPPSCRRISSRPHGRCGSPRARAARSPSPPRHSLSRQVEGRRRSPSSSSASSASFPAAQPRCSSPSSYSSVSERGRKRHREVWRSAKSAESEAVSAPVLEQASSLPLGSPPSVLDDRGTPFLDPETLKHPRSSEWSPSPGVAAFFEKYLRHQLSNKARQRLRAECPRPSLKGDVQATPAVDKSLLTYCSSKLGKDPHKGLDRSLKAVQDKLLDISGPLARIFKSAEDGLDGHRINPQELRDWVQRCVWMLGNANTALSGERRRNFLLKISLHSTDLALKEFGPDAKGLLFGDPFLKELSQTVRTFSSLDHASSSLRRSLAPRVFGRAGGNRGPPSGCGQASSQAAPRGDFRGFRGSFRRGFQRSRGSRPDARGRDAVLSGKHSCFKSKGPQPYLVSGSTPTRPDCQPCSGFWTDSVLFPQLGKGNRRPLGTGRHSGIPARVRFPPRYRTLGLGSRGSPWTRRFLSAKNWASWCRSR